MQTIDTKYKYRFSIFTSTYNRGRKLRDLYNDILNQTFKDFEWVLVNDGSTDETDQIIQEFIQENRIAINYIKQSNSGKHGAWRNATEAFKGQYITTFDDDDPIKPDALKIMDSHWSELEKSPDYADFWEIRTRCELPTGELVGQCLSSPYFDSNCLEMTYKYGVFCEMNSCAKVEVLRKEAAVPETFLLDDIASNFPEIIRWCRAARNYKTRYLPEVTRVYVPNEHGYCTIKNERITANNLITNIYMVNEHHDYMTVHQPLKYLKRLAAIAYFSDILNHSHSQFLHYRIDRFLTSLLHIILYIPFKIKTR